MNYLHLLLLFSNLVAVPQELAPKIVEIVKSREDFSAQLKTGEFSSGIYFRSEEYHGTRLAQCWEIKIRDGFHVARYFGRDKSNPLDDTIFVLGPKYAFSVTIAGVGADGIEKYNLAGIVKADARLDPESTFFQGITGVQEGAFRYPWRYEGLDLEDLVSGFEKVEVQDESDGAVRIILESPREVENLIKNKMVVDRRLDIVFVKDGNYHLSTVAFQRENYNSVGKLTERFSGTRSYYLKDGEFGHGIFENDKFVKGADSLVGTNHTIEFGRRIKWSAVEIAPAEFTPEFYGIDPGIGVARAGINWWLWGTVIGCALMILVGLWLKRRSS